MDPNDPYADLPDVTFGTPRGSDTIITPGAGPDPSDPYADLPDVDAREITQPQSPAWSAIDAGIEGATFGLDKHLYAQFGYPREEVQRQRDANLRAHPWPVQSGYVLGSIASAMVPPAAIGRIPLAGRALNAILPNANVFRSAERGVSAGRLMGEGAKAGAKVSTLQGLGDTREETIDGDPMGRITDIAGQAALGGAVGAPLNWAGARLGEGLTDRLSNIYARLTQADRLAGDAQRAGRTNVVQALRDDGIESIDDLRSVVLPDVRRTSARAAIPNDEMESVVTAFHGTDGSRASKLAAARAAYRANPGVQALGLTDETLDRHVSRILTRWERRNAVPSNVPELAAVARGNARAMRPEAKNTALAYQSGVNSGGPQAQNAAQWARDRQANLADDIRGAMIGGDMPAEEAVAANIARIRSANDPYSEVISGFRQAPDSRVALRSTIERVIDEEIPALMALGDDHSLEAIRQLSKFRRPTIEVDGQQPVRLDADGRPYYELTPDRTPSVDPSGNPIVPTTIDAVEDPTRQMRGLDDIEALIAQRGVLRDAVEAARREGNTQLASRLGRVQHALNRALSQSNDPNIQAWWQINMGRANAQSLNDAYELGERVPLKSGTITQLMAVFEEFFQLDAPQQQAVREGLLANIEAKLNRLGEGHDVKKIFDNRQTNMILRQILGDERVDDLMPLIDRAGLASKSFKADKGSQTDPLRNTRTQQGALQRMVSTVRESLSPGKMLDSVLDASQTQLDAQRIDTMMQMLGANTSDPVALFQVLREIERQYGEVAAAQALQAHPAFEVLRHAMTASAPFVAGQMSQADPR